MPTDTVNPGTIAVTPGSGVLLDSVALTVGVNNVQSETVVIRDPGNATQYAEVNPKGTQADNFIGVQLPADCGRTYVTLYARLIAGVTTEALATFTKNVNGTETTGQTAYTITSGKTFRIIALTTAIKNTTTTANSCTYNIRIAASVTATSPLVASCGCSSIGAVSGQQGFAQLSIFGGIDIVGNGTIQIGVSHLENVTTAAISSFSLIGYEY